MLTPGYQGRTVLDLCLSMSVSLQEERYHRRHCHCQLSTVRCHSTVHGGNSSYQWGQRQDPNLACIDSSEHATGSEGKEHRGSEAVSRTEGWITFLISLSTHRANYLLIVLQAPGNVTRTCKLVRHVVHGRNGPFGRDVHGSVICKVTV